jgi:hypothetical protein
MASVDNFPALALGDVLDESQSHIINYKCAAAITKGQVVVFSAHVAGELPTIDVAGAAAANCLGVALKTGAIGEAIPVLKRGVVKVTASGGITGGVPIVSGAAGAVVTFGANTFDKVIGRAEQTFLTTDTGLASIDCEGA